MFDGSQWITITDEEHRTAPDPHTQYALADGSRGSFAAPLGADENYVTDAEKTKLSNLSGTNTGDQDLSGLASKSGQFPVLALTAAASVTLSADYPAQTLTMAQNTSLVAPTPSEGHAIVFLLSGEFTPTWWAGIKWAGGTAPTYVSAGTLYHLLYLGAAGWLASGQAYA